MIRAVLLTSSMLLLTLLVACGGTQVPTHSGYKGKKPRPWEKPKVLKLEKNAAKFDVDLDYARFKRARWLAVDLPGPGSLQVDLDVTARGGGGGTSDEGEELDLDVGAELLDGVSWNVLARSNLETDDAHDLKKTLKAADLPEGRYYIHLYLQGRLDAADVEVKVAFARGALPWKSDFPNQVAFVDVLPAIPPLDDAPEPTKKPRITRVTTTRTDKPRKDPKEPEPTGAGGLVMAEISNVEPDAGGGTLVTIGAGTADGLENGLSGSIKGVRNSSFRLSGCSPATCRAKVKAPIDDVRGAAGVTIKLK